MRNFVAWWLIVLTPAPWCIVAVLMYRTLIRLPPADVLSAVFISFAGMALIVLAGVFVSEECWRRGVALVQKPPPPWNPETTMTIEEAETMLRASLKAEHDRLLDELSKTAPALASDIRMMETRE